MAQSATSQQLADYLVTGYWTEQGSTPHGWNTSSDNVISVNISGLTADGQALARAAFAAWESVADIDFRETTGKADITFDDAGGTSANTSVSYDPTTGDMVSASVNITTGWLAKYGTTVGSYSFQTYMHEIGHALGLGHTGPYDSDASFSEAKFTIDSWQQSVMSYFDQDENTVVDATKVDLVTPMMADILAIQKMYGKPTTGPTAGDTIYGVGSDLGTYLDSFFAGRSGSPTSGGFTIYDISGTDTFNFSNDTRNQDVDLNPGTFSDVYGQVGNFGIAYSTGIEHYKAGSGSDKVFGNNLSNQVTGNGGNDAFDGNGGNDALYGGDGNDTLKSGDDNDRLEGGNGNDLLNGGNGNDKLYGGNNNDNLSGVSGNDIVDGGTGNDLLYGGTGNSTLYGGDGVDRIDGGTGADTFYGGTGADSFVLMGGSGKDAILGGFEDNVDTLVLDNALWGNRLLTVDQVLALAKVVNGDVVFDFGGGNTVTIDGLSSTLRLLDDIAFA